jgi:hypothetical protein
VPASAGLANHRVRAEVVGGDGAPLRAVAGGRFLPLEVDTDLTSGALVGGIVCVGDSGRVLVVVRSGATSSAP